MIAWHSSSFSFLSSTNGNPMVPVSKSQTACTLMSSRICCVTTTAMQHVSAQSNRRQQGGCGTSSIMSASRLGGRSMCSSSTCQRVCNFSAPPCHTVRIRNRLHHTFYGGHSIHHKAWSARARQQNQLKRALQSAGKLVGPLHWLPTCNPIFSTYWRH